MCVKRKAFLAQNTKNLLNLKEMRSKNNKKYECSKWILEYRFVFLPKYEAFSGFHPTFSVFFLHSFLNWCFPAFLLPYRK